MQIIYDIIDQLSVVVGICCIEEIKGLILDQFDYVNLEVKYLEVKFYEVDFLVMIMLFNLSY